MHYLPNSCLVLFFLFSLFHNLPCAPSKKELESCNTLFHCGNITTGFPFSGGNRPKVCGHPLLKLHCLKNTTSLIISNKTYDILHVNQTSKTLRLAKEELRGSFCTANYTEATLPPEIFELSPTYKSLTVFYHCDLKNPYRLSYTCPARGPISVSRTLDYHNSCKDNFTINVPKSFVPEEKELNLTHLESVLREGFDVKVKIDEKSCQECSSSHGICSFKNTTSSVCNTLNPPDDNNQVCSSCTAPGDYCWYDRRSSSYICTFTADINNNKRTRNKSLSGGPIAAIFLGLVVGVIILFWIMVKALSRKRNTSNDLGQQKALTPQPKLKALIPLKQYSYAEVHIITHSFAQVVGKGGFGIVYRGTLCNGRSVAVKVLKDSKANNEEDFINEVATMSQTSHVNILTLIGFCSEGPNRAIFYEFMENGSLDKFISIMKSSNMKWKALFRIALGVARGLEYLHHGCRTRIIHFDIKPHNVLLDCNFCPKVADFGLAKLCERKESILSLLDTRGTIGYIAPELFSRMYGRVSHKSDVYSYGMLILEMIGARDRESAAQNAEYNASSMYFPEWIYKDLEKGDIGRLNTDGILSEKEEITKKMTLVGLWCIQSSPSVRPPMNRVVEMMEGSVDALKVPPKPGLQIPLAPLQESSTLADDLSFYTDDDL